jgi:ElaB/YqjD/DUF883 family membrane-anchored ribosome-binding protein
MATQNHQIHQQMSMSTSGSSYFGIEELGSKSLAEDQDIPLTWRGDPSETMSDWTIVVVTNELQTFTYHVHKSVLCYGPRQSRYMSKLILNHQSSSSSSSSQKKSKHRSTRTTKVELDQRDADNIPILLDFIYAPCSYNSCNGTVATSASTITTPSLLTAPSEDCSLVLEDITHHNSVSLRHLARIFEIDSLMLAVNRFIQRDLNLKSGPKYLMEASEYKDERLLESAQRLCIDNFEQLDVKTLYKLPVHIFRRLIVSLENYEEDDDNLSRFMSEVVCRYLEKHPKQLSAELLLELTDSLLMPCLASEAAIGFTALIKRLDMNETEARWNELVDLARRCAKNVVQEYGWNDFSVSAAVDEYLGNTREGPAKVVSRTDSLLFATSFAAALEQAQDDYEQVVVEQEQLEDTVNTLFQSVARLEECNLKKDECLEKQQRAIEEAKKQILRLKDQVSTIKKDQLRRYPDNTIRGASPVRGVGARRELVAPSRTAAAAEQIHRHKSDNIREMRSKSAMRGLA